MAALASTVAAIALLAAAATVGYTASTHLAGRWRNVARSQTARGPATAHVAVLLHRQRAGSYTLDVINEGPGIAYQNVVEQPSTNSAHPVSMLRSRLPADIGRLLRGERESINVHTAGFGILELTPVVHWNDRSGHRHRQLTVAG